MPHGVLPLVRERKGSPEIVHEGQLWEAGDRVILLSLAPPDETLAALDALVRGKRES